MNQVVDLEGSPQFVALHVVLVSISTDPRSEIAQAVAESGVASPHLSDPGGEVSSLYGVLQWAMPSGEPGHTFVLVGEDGRIRWIRDYGAPENGGLMYVPVDDLVSEIQIALTNP
jgi:peroxiredoxin Q/BCP